MGFRLFSHCFYRTRRTPKVKDQLSLFACSYILHMNSRVLLNMRMHWCVCSCVLCVLFTTTIITTAITIKINGWAPVIIIILIILRSHLHGDALAVKILYETAIFGNRVPEWITLKNDTLVLTCVQPIRIFLLDPSQTPLRHVTATTADMTKEKF